MKTATFIQASAEITTIVSLKKGDVYKRLEESSYDDKIIHGLVLDVLYDGSDAAIQAMEFKSGYNSLETTFKTFSGNKDIKVFASSQSEVEQYLKDCVSHIEQDLESKKKEVSGIQDKLTQAKLIMTGDLIKQLTTPEIQVSRKEIE